GVHGLAEELDFGIAAFSEFAEFSEDASGVTAALGPTSKRNDAVGAGFIATFDDGDVSSPVVVAARDFSFKSFVGVVVEAGDALFSGFKPGQHFRQVAVTG